MIDDQDLVGQIQHQIALVRGPRQTQLHRLELEHEVIAERAIEPEMLVFAAAEQIDQRAQHRKHRGLAAALFFGKALVASADLAVDPLVVAVARGASAARVSERSGHGRQQHPAARVQRLDRETPAARGEQPAADRQTPCPSACSGREIRSSTKTAPRAAHRAPEPRCNPPADSRARKPRG